MDLWSKGLGRRVLSLSLAERDTLETRRDALVISGVMHAPTYWDYEVTLDRQDVVEFLDLLQRPDVVRFVSVDAQRTPMLRTAIASAALFAVRTLGLLVRRPKPATEAITTDEEVGAAHGRT